jgi:uncharacterized protein (DUF983 family)
VFSPKPQIPCPKFRTLLWRGCRKKCPQCGQGDIYQGWIKLRENCTVCGLRFLPDQGDLWGPLLFLDRVLFIIPLIVIIYFRQLNPDMIWLLLIGGVILFTLIFTLPHRNGMSLAIDYLIRRKAGDLSDEDGDEK